MHDFDNVKDPSLCLIKGVLIFNKLVPLWWKAVQRVQWVQKNVPVFCLESSRGSKVQEIKSKILTQGCKVNFDYQDVEGTNSEKADGFWS